MMNLRTLMCICSCALLLGLGCEPEETGISASSLGDPIDSGVSGSFTPDASTENDFGMPDASTSMDSDVADAVSHWTWGLIP